MRKKLKTLNDMISENPVLLNSAVIIPEDGAELNADALKLAVVRRCGDVEPYYQQETDFTTFSAMWFSTHSFLFAHALGIWNATYNPIENYDRTEEETVTDTRTGTESKTDTHGGTDATTTNGNTETGITGFNSLDYVDANQVTETGTELVQHGHTIDMTGESTEDNERIRSARIHGNIGVTTAQQMLDAEMELARRFWVYDYIASAFESENFITVYKSYYEGEQWTL